jgi:hypothetical protein
LPTACAKTLESLAATTGPAESFTAQRTALAKSTLQSAGA